MSGVLPRLLATQHDAGGIRSLAHTSEIEIRAAATFKDLSLVIALRGGVEESEVFVIDVDGRAETAILGWIEQQRAIDAAVAEHRAVWEAESPCVLLRDA